MNRRPIGLIDVDGVLADFVGATLEEVHSRTTLRWKRSELITYEIFDHFVDPLNPDLARDVRRAIEKRGWCESLSPIPGAKRAIAEMRSLGVHVKALTAPWKTSRHWIGERIEWLMGNFGFSYADIINTSDKSNVHGKFLVDDKVSNVCDWLDYQFTTSRSTPVGIIWNTPHNGAELLSPTVASPIRVDTWAQVDAWVRLALSSSSS